VRRMILPLMLFAVAACQQSGVATLTDEDIAALSDLGPAHTEAVLAGDFDAVVAMYTEDAQWLAPDAPALEGRAAIRAVVGPAQGRTLQDFTITSAEIDGYGDLAFDRGTWSQTFITEGATEPVTVTGKYVVISRKQDDGSWLVAVDIWNADAPRPQPEQP